MHGEIMTQPELDLYKQPPLEEMDDPGEACQDMSIEAQFKRWKELPGSKQVLRQAYRFASHYAKDYRRYGKRLSVKLVWELTRHHIKLVRARALAAGVDLKDWQGYKLNNNFTQCLSRHMVDHRPEWDGMFEMRQTSKEKMEESIEKLEKERGEK